MARTPGRFGRIYLAATSGGSASPIAATRSWTIDSASEQFDATAQGDTSKTYGQGLPGGSGSFEAFYESGTYAGDVFTAAREGTARAMYAYPDATDSSKYWFATCFVSASVTSDVGGMTTVSGQFSAATDLIPVGIA